MANPNIAIEKVLKREGGLSDVKQDHGGRTKYGVTKPVLAEAIRLGLIAPGRTIDDLTRAEAALIYRVLFWDKMRLAEIRSQAIAGEVFDTGVNGAPATGIKILQRALVLWDRSIVADGKIGPKTIALTNQVCTVRKDEVLLYKLLNLLQGDRYIDLVLEDPSQMTFLRGWVNERVSLDPATEEK